MPSESLEAELVRALPRLRAHLARRGADPDDAVQEAATRALRGRASFDAGRGGIWPWLRRIGERALFDAGRRRREAPEPRADLEPVDPSGAVAASAAERAEALRMVAGLPAREREVLWRFHVDGEPIAAIAAALGRPAGTIKSDLSRARRRLAAWHGPLDDEGHGVRRDAQGARRRESTT